MERRLEEVRSGEVFRLVTPFGRLFLFLTADNSDLRG